MTDESIAVLLDQARRDRVAVAPPAALAALSLAAAYDLQDAVVALREREGPQSGWKLGITSPVKQRVMGIAHPLFGRTFAASEWATGDDVPFDAFIAPRTEPELAFGLATPLGAGMDRAAARAAIAWIAPALEITDSRFRSGPRSANELVADNTSSAGYVIGPRSRPNASLATIETLLVQNDVVVQRGRTDDVLGDPVLALVRLGEHIAARGLQTRAGDIVLSGAITDAVPVSRGDVIEARLTGAGSATIRFV
jgi:2-keto-4-pentenoate hydratase